MTAFARRLIVGALSVPLFLTGLGAAGAPPPTAPRPLAPAAPPREGATPFTFSKNFGAFGFPLGDTTTLLFFISNPNGLAFSGLAFTDTLTGGLQIATPNGLSNTCGGTVTAIAATESISLTGGTIAANAACEIELNVVGTSAGIVDNTTSTLTSTAGPTSAAASATVNVVGPPAFTKAFGPTTVVQGQNSTVTFALTNNNENFDGSGGLAGLAFSDTLPSGMVVATPNGLTGSCGGGTITAAAGSGSISLAGAALAVGASCTFAVNVTTSASGSLTNTTSSLTYTCPFFSISSSGRRTLANPPACTQFPATATLTVDPSVPLFGPAGLGVFALLLAGAALLLLRRRTAGRHPGAA